MEVQFLEKYFLISDMKVGDIAVSKDRKDVYICAWMPNKDCSDCHKGVIRLNAPNDQYVHKYTKNTPVKILTLGEKIIVQR